MEAKDFIRKWRDSALKERAAAQAHFLDLCRLLGEPTPADVDPSGVDYGFEVGATKTTGGRGFADVFKRGFFAWEYKGAKANLDAAFAQLQRYAVALDNPPLLVVSDIGSLIRIHTNWTNTVSKVYEIPISDLGDAKKRAWLKAVFSDPEALRPKKTRQQLTEEVAAEFAKLAGSLRERGHAPQLVAHFINRLVFCMFAEDVKLLPDNIFSRMLDRALEEPGEFEAFARDLFAAMKSGGRVGFERIAWFNGGLFDDDFVIALTRSEIGIVRDAAAQYWGDIDPSILGTLFERGLDPEKRSQLGAHYTDRDKIMMIIDPVIVEPLTAEWERTKAEITSLMEKASIGTGGTRTKARNRAQTLLDQFLNRLGDFRVLDPACGSGNFLYLALRSLKDIEHRAQVEAEALGLPRGFPRIGPEVVQGIEINPYAAELARVSVWIGEIQWMLKNGFSASQNPILKPLNTIENRDALLNEDGTEAIWPKVDAIIGNPPFLGGRKLLPELGAEYISKIRSVYGNAVPNGADFVCFWFHKAQQVLSFGPTRVGLVATNSISGGKNQRVLRSITETSSIFRAWDDEPWAVEGAAVRVAIVCFANSSSESVLLNGEIVDEIYPDLTGRSGRVGVNLSSVLKLPDNLGIAFQGVVPRGSINRRDAERLGLPEASFVLPGGVARDLLRIAGNPNGRPNSDVVVPYIVGDEVVNRPLDRYIIDFYGKSEFEASLYGEAFKCIEPVRLHRRHMNQREALETWWQHWNGRPKMRQALANKTKYIATPRVSKHRIFRWVSSGILPDNMVIAIASEEDAVWGILSSRFHELWTLRLCTFLGVGNDPRYTPSTVFETFPFPEGLNAKRQSSTHEGSDPFEKIAEIARRLNQLRETWLNPAELVSSPVIAELGLNPQLHAVDASAEKELRGRTLTKLYNDRPSWLRQLHSELDAAVAEAYGWSDAISDDDALDKLFKLNQHRGSDAGEIIHSLAG
ncbi:class I SAM-dependent DNA methyltransferase [Sinorhizobium fredii]|uniref:site-specific DNA-methyltransferase (adenine-specific) n=1 Tax=Rhizobium fredii TaxID=380 RepID=A0A2L0H9H2_RHIFR|nr:DNA methyltransferase [Sinorhizobium fredii]AUX78123.1 type II restriction enzyme methylase subunit protein [Sinorhizobium fredii]